MKPQPWETIFHFGKQNPNFGKPFSILENETPTLGDRYPFWKMKPQLWETIFHFGKRNPNFERPLSILENEFAPNQTCISGVFDGFSG